MLTYEIINRPASSAVGILTRKACDKRAMEQLAERQIEAVGLIQGTIAQVIAAADIAEKAADVVISEIAGSCPQHITLIAIFGDVSAVKTALAAVQNKKK